MIRLLQLFKNDRISEEEWSEFTALPIEQASEMKRGKLAELIYELAKTFQKLVGPPLSQDAIIDLLCAVSKSSIQEQLTTNC